MSKKAGAAIGLLTAGTVLALLIAGAKGNKTTQVSPVAVQLDANPITTILLVDDKEVETPAKILLTPGVHSFAAVPISPDFWITYGFDRWTQNGQTMSNNTKATFYVQPPCTIKAEYILYDVGKDAPARPDSLPNPQGPMTPNLIMPNQNLAFSGVKET